MTRWKKEVDALPESKIAREWNAADYDGDGNTRYPLREQVYRYGWSLDPAGFGLLNRIAAARRNGDRYDWNFAVALYDQWLFNARIDRVAPLPG